MKTYWIYKGFKILFMMVFFIGVFGFITMTLWNWLIPDLFGLSVISLSQAIGLVVLSKILFGNFPGRRWGHGGKSHWYGKMRKRYEGLSPEEKEKYKDRWGHYCRPWTSDDQDEGGVSPEVKTDSTPQ